MKEKVWLFILIAASTECYKLKLLNFTECQNPDPPIVDNVREQLFGTVESYTEDDKMLIKGNVTVVRDFRFWARFQLLEHRRKGNDKIDVKAITCRNVISRMLLQITKIKYDANECRIFKGHYVFKDLDISKIERAVTFIPTLKRGVVRWYFGIYNKHGTYACYEICARYD